MIKKLFYSFLLFLSCWYIMIFFGGVVATYRFQRVNQNVFVEPLPDVMFSLFEYFDIDGSTTCNLKIPDLMIFVNFVIVVIEIYVNKYNGVLILQKCLHISSIIFLIRTTVVGLTGLPNPNNRCLPIQNIAMKYNEALYFVLSSFPHHACGDLIFSGHTAILLTWLLELQEIGLLNWWKFKNYRILNFLLWRLNSFAILNLIICKYHYTVDVILGIWFTLFVVYLYNNCKNPKFLSLKNYMEIEKPNIFRV